MRLPPFSGGTGVAPEDGAIFENQRLYGLERRERLLDGNGGVDPSSGIGALDVEARAWP